MNIISSCRLATAVALVVLLAGCGGGGGGAAGGGGGPTGSGGTGSGFKPSSGVAQKGPLQSGSSVTTQELDDRLAPTGTQFTYQITSDLGTFTPTGTYTRRF